MRHAIKATPSNENAPEEQPSHHDTSTLPLTLSPSTLSSALL